MSKVQELYKKEIAAGLQASASQVSLYWKGRVALYAILKAMGVGKGDEVILPAYTCVVVPNAILYLGAIPVYVDINPATYNADIQSIKQARTARTKAVICQNTFGLSSQVDESALWTKENNIFSIEDCTHGYGGIYNNKPNGSYCDAAFYSTQWNKPFSTGVGGFALINNPSLSEKLQKVNQQLEAPGMKDVLMLKALLFVRKNILTPANYWRMVSLYRWLSKYNIVVGSSRGEEIRGTAFPSGYFKKLSDVQAKEGLKNIRKIDALIAQRRKNALTYHTFLKEHGKVTVPEEEFKNHSFLKFPLLVKDRATFERNAQLQQVEITNYFCSPLHPVETNLEPWMLDVSKTPVAADIAAHMVNLPCDVNDIEPVLRFLSQNMELIVEQRADALVPDNYKRL
jgi:dTDP-4-amino-4,6-dideoxygalactose transaminase